MPEDGTRTSRHGRAPLLGREIELADLDDLIGVAATGNGRAVVLEGPAGIGKTELVEVARERARSAGLRVLMARADELETAYPHGVVRQWLERAWSEGSDGRPAGDAAELVLSRVPAVAPVGEDAFGAEVGVPARPAGASRAETRCISSSSSGRSRSSVRRRWMRARSRSTRSHLRRCHGTCSRDSPGCTKTLRGWPGR